MNIVIGKKFATDHTTRVAGEKLRHMIISCKENIILDFKNTKIASASFFDEGIAKLALHEWTTGMIKERIKFINLFKMDEMLLKEVCESRNIFL